MHFIDQISYWKWAHSDLLCNRERGVLAEYIVAQAINYQEPRIEWDDYDLVTQNGLKIEVKSAAYIQTWHDSESTLSKIRFSIKPAKRLLDSQGNRTVNASILRPSDIYVFCLLATQDRNILNPLDLSQWDFYVLPTSILNQQCPKQQTIGLSSLLDLNPTYAKYDQLNSVICDFGSKTGSF